MCVYRMCVCIYFFLVHGATKRNRVRVDSEKPIRTFCPSHIIFRIFDTWHIFYFDYLCSLCLNLLSSFYSHYWTRWWRVDEVLKVRWEWNYLHLTVPATRHRLAPILTLTCLKLKIKISTSWINEKVSQHRVSLSKSNKKRKLKIQKNKKKYCQPR